MILVAGTKWRARDRERGLTMAGKLGPGQGMEGRLTKGCWRWGRVEEHER